MRGQALGANPDTFGEGISAIGKALIARMSDRRIAPREEAERARSGSEMARIMAMLQGSGGGYPVPSPMPAPMPAPMPQPAPEMPAQGAPLPPVATGPIPLPPSIGAAVDRVAPPALTGGAGTDVIPGGPGADTLANPADTIRAGLIERGLPPHVADGFVMNFQSESGLRPDINEVSPVVPGSRGGYGLAQWTGPRRRELEDFAAQRGVPASDMNAQLDFLMTELQGPESRAAQSIMAAPDSASAADAVLRQFLRPASEHVASRSAQYTGGAGTDTMMGQAGNDRLGTGGVDPAIIAQLAELSSNPYLPEGQRMIAQMLIQQQMGQMFQAPMSPLEQIQLEQAQLELDQMRNPSVEPADQPSSVQEYEYYLAQVPEGETPKSYLEFTTADERAGNPSFTEAQGKDVVFGTRAEGALAVLDQPQGDGYLSDSLTSRQDRALGSWIANPFGTGVGRENQSDAYQVARQAGDEFLQAILRKDTGAAITEDEQVLYGETYLPQPGDNAAVLEAKRLARIRAVEALNAGMNPSQMVARDQALISAAERGAATANPAAGDDAPLTPEERAFLGIE